MTKIATRPAKLGEVLKAELLMEHGFARKAATVNVTSTMEIGSVVKTDGDGTYSIVVAANVATLPTDVGIVVDNALYDNKTTGDREIAILVGGPGASGGAIVVKEALKFGDALSAAQVNTVVAALEARGIKVGTQV